MNITAGLSPSVYGYAQPKRLHQKTIDVSQQPDVRFGLANPAQLLTRFVGENGFSAARIAAPLIAASQVLNNHGTNLSYGARAAARNGTTPYDRRMDYYFRDLYMSVVTAFAFEAAFRSMDAWYAVPLTTQQLGLNRLANDYKDLIEQRLGQPLTPELAKKINYDRLPPELHGRLVGSFAKDTSHYLIPELLEADLEKMLDKSADPVEKVRAEVLLKQVYKRLNYPQYLEKYEKGLPAQTREEIAKLLRQAETEAKDALAQQAKQSAQNAKGLSGKLRSFASKAHLEKPEEILEKLISQETLTPEGQKLVQQGWESGLARMAMAQVRKSASWPKLVFNLMVNIVYFGIVGNWFDLHVLQPWQKKISEERGGVHELIGPAYAGLIPGGVAFGLLMSNKAAAKLGLAKAGLTRLTPAVRFLVAGTLGLVTYTASSYGLVMHRLQKLRKEKPVYKPSMPTGMNLEPNRQPVGAPLPFNGPTATPARVSNGFATSLPTGPLQSSAL
jgi:hypothetical protein